MILSWVKCQNDNWCSLERVNLANEHFNNLEGLYVIWHGGDEPKVVRVGQGKIKDRLTAHRNDEEITAYSHLGLYVTWASVDGRFRDGVEKYLADELDPLEGDRFPNRTPIEVNLPW